MAKHKQIGMAAGSTDFRATSPRFPEDDAVVIVLSNNQAANAGEWQARLRQRCSAKS